jgi:hypothetical protein
VIPVDRSVVVGDEEDDVVADDDRGGRVVADEDRGARVVLDEDEDGGSGVAVPITASSRRS